MLPPQMMSLLAVYITFEVKQATGQSHRREGHLGEFSLPQPVGFAMSGR